MLDNIDLTILRLLQTDSSLNSGEIAEKLNMSQSPTWRRIKRLEDEGYIKKYVAILDREKLDLDLIVFATINLTHQDDANLKTFELAMTDETEVIECYTMAGAWDYLLKVSVKDIKHYERFVRAKLGTNPLVREIHSHISVTEIKNTTELPIT